MAASEPFSSLNQQEEDDDEEERIRHDQLILSLPKHKGWGTSQLHLYQGFWYPTKPLSGILFCQAHFKSLDSDLLLITTPKSGTTWLKAIAFSLVNRGQHPINALHPLTTLNPHDLVPFLEYNQNSTSNKILTLTPPRLLASHLPFSSLPRSIQESNCKIVYLCREPRDTFISQWQFTNKLKDPNNEPIPLEEALNYFCQGESIGGPFWDHVLGYWNASLKMPSRVLFLKYEDIKGNPESSFARIAEFLGFPFSPDEEKDSVIGKIIGLCSFENLSTLEVNKNGKGLLTGVDNKSFFRRGEIGDWVNHLTPKMSDLLLKTIEEKLSGSDLKF